MLSSGHSRLQTPFRFCPLIPSRGAVLQVRADLGVVEVSESQQARLIRRPVAQSALRQKMCAFVSTYLRWEILCWGRHVDCYQTLCKRDSVHSPARSQAVNGPDHALVCCTNVRARNAHVLSRGDVTVNGPGLASNDGTASLPLPKGSVLRGHTCSSEHNRVVEEYLRAQGRRQVTAG